MNLHQEGGFAARFYQLFQNEIQTRYPDLEDRFGPFSQASLKRRRDPNIRPGDWQFDAEAVIHTPNSIASKGERGTHWKSTNKLLEAHLFLRHPDDESEGGDLVLYQKEPESCFHRGERNQVIEGDLRISQRIPYTSNTLFLFLNTPDTITRILPRGPGRFPFQYFIFVLQLPGDLFELPS